MRAARKQCIHYNTPESEKIKLKPEKKRKKGIFVERKSQGYLYGNSMDLISAAFRIRAGHITFGEISGDCLPTTALNSFRIVLPACLPIIHPPE